MPNIEIAKTILQQLGGNRFIAMTGAKQFIPTEFGLRFRLPNPKVNAVEVKLRADDTYTVYYSRIRGDKNIGVAVESGIYCDQLEESFTRNTGLYTRL